MLSTPSENSTRSRPRTGVKIFTLDASVLDVFHRSSLLRVEQQYERHLGVRYKGRLSSSTLEQLNLTLRFSKIPR